MTPSISPTVKRAPDTALGSAVDAAVDTVRHAAHLSHEAQLLKTVAADIVEDGVYAAKRVLKKARRVTERAADLRDQAEYRIKREPFKFVGLAVAIGIPIGLLLGWVGARGARRRGASSADAPHGPAA
jgi:ElaB/YqjD/DUF883 family membrane-anchored ribosome-binding protein